MAMLRRSLGYGILLLLWAPWTLSLLSSFRYKDLQSWIELFDVNHQLQYYHENSHEFLSMLSLEWAKRIENPLILNSYVTCSAYRDLSRAKEFFNQHEIPHELIYLSVEKNQNCFLFESTLQSLDMLNSSAVPFFLLVPFPDHLKVDPSMMTFLNWLEDKIQNTSTTSYDQLPHIQHYQERPLDLSISFSSSKHHSLSPHLLSSLLEHLNTKEVHCSLCSRNIERIVHSPYISPLLLYFKRQPSIRAHSHWDRWAKSWNSFKSSPLSSCGIRSKQFSFRTHEIRFHPTTDQLRRHECLTALVATVISSKDITKVSLSYKLRTLNDFSRGVVQTGTPGEEIYTERHLTGKGVVIGQADTGIDELSCFFIDNDLGVVPRSTIAHPTYNHSYRKVIQYVNYTSNGDVPGGHGTHTAGILSGHCVNETDLKSKYNGIAMDSKIAFFDLGASVEDGSYLETPEDVSDMFKPSYAAGATIHSDSWGGGYWYDSYCYEVDKYLYQHKNMVILFAAGNSGSYGMHSVLSPSISKNAIAVGATGSGHNTQQRITSPAFFSSIGPTPDGRIKPDIMAPGWSTFSSKSQGEGRLAGMTCEVSTKSGTSMAAPTAAGVAALITQYFIDQDFWFAVCDKSHGACHRGPFHPSGYLLKALLIHSGTPIATSPERNGNGDSHGSSTSPTPDLQQGYGRIFLRQLLPLQNDTFLLYVDEREAPEASQLKYIVNIPPNSTVPLKVSLAWFFETDNSPHRQVLLHDIDLVVIDPSGRVYFGNTLSTASTDYTIETSRDLLNTNEQVFVSTPADGDWIILIETKLLSESHSQHYALVLTAAMGAIIYEPDNATTLPENILEQCYPGSPLNPEMDHSTLKSLVDVSIFNFWSSLSSVVASSVSISQALDPTKVLRNSTTIDTTETLYTLSEHHQVYEAGSVCLAEGCYTAYLNWERDPNNSIEIVDAMGLLAELPVCGTFLSPFVHSQDFCVDRIFDGEVNIPSTLQCRTSCDRDDHIEITISLGTSTVEGWVGTYYTVHDYNPTSIDSMYDYAGRNTARFGGTLEWGNLDEKTLCLPAKAQCYEFVLWSQLNSDVHSPNVRVSRTSDDDIPYPFVLFASNVSADYAEPSCPLNYAVDENTTVALICTDGYSHYNVSYHQLANPERSHFTSSVYHSSPEFVRSGMPYLKEPNWTCNSLPIVTQISYPPEIKNRSSMYNPEFLIKDNQIPSFEESALYTCDITTEFYEFCNLSDITAFLPHACLGASWNASLQTASTKSSWCYYGVLDKIFCPIRFSVRNREVDAESWTSLINEIDTAVSLCQRNADVLEVDPTALPTSLPTFPPSSYPSREANTSVPTCHPSIGPSSQPVTSTPTLSPLSDIVPDLSNRSISPSSSPSSSPSALTSSSPSTSPTWNSIKPSLTPTHVPSMKPSTTPTSVPSHAPTRHTNSPTHRPSSRHPTYTPSIHPTDAVFGPPSITTFTASPTDVQSSSGLSGKSNPQNSFGGAFSSVFAISFLAGLLICIGFYFLIFRSQSWSPLRPSREHSLLRSGSDHGDESDHQIEFEDFMGKKPLPSNSHRNNFQLAPGIEIGPGYRQAANTDEDDILEITL